MTPRPPKEVPDRTRKGIYGCLDTFKVEGEPKSVIHKGWVRVADGSIRAGDVLLLQVPDPAPNVCRTTLKFESTGDGGFARIEVLDRPLPPRNDGVGS